MEGNAWFSLYNGSMRLRVSNLLVLFVIASCQSLATGLQGAPKNTSATQKPDFAKIAESVFRIEAGDSVGTGFLFLKNDTVATCYHVIKGATVITVTGSNDAKWTVVGVQALPKSDVALLTLDRPSSRAVLQPSKANPEMGEPVYVIGNALGFLTNSLSNGVVSAKRTADGVDLIQFTAPISHGNSGSPLFDRDGGILGVVSFTFSGGQALNMAVAASVLVPVALLPVSAPAALAVEEKTASEKSSKESIRKPMAELTDEITRLKLLALDMAPGIADQEAALARFMRFWERFCGSSDSEMVFSRSDYKSFRDDVDSFQTAVTRWLNATREYDAAYEHAGKEASAETNRNLGEAATKQQNRCQDAWNACLELSKRAYFSKADIEDLVGACTYQDVFGVPIRSSEIKDERHSFAVPDPAWPRKCVLGARLFPTNGNQLCEDYHNREVQRKTNGLRSTYPTYDEGADAVAVAKTGWTVFAIREIGGDWQEVTDWRSLSIKAWAILKKGIDVKAQLSRKAEILVGPSRSEARAISVTLGIIL